METKNFIGIEVTFFLHPNKQEASDLSSNFICNLNIDEWLKPYDNKPIIYGGGAFGETILTNEEIAIILEKKLGELMEEIENGI
jgi:hypothetical protein